MRSISRFAPWIQRIVLGMAAVIFTRIGLRFVTDPVQASAARGVTLGSSLAATTTRVGFGAFPLALAVFSLTCLLSAKRRRAGVGLVATVLATVIAVRLFSLAADGAAAESVRLFAPEAVMLVLSLSGLFLEATRPNHPKGETI